MAGSDPRDLRAYYQRLSDDALAELHAAGPADYVPEAWALLDQEFQLRQASPSPVDPSTDAPPPEYSAPPPPPERGGDALDLVTVFASGDPVRILMAKAALETAGLPFLTKGEGIQDLIGAGRLFARFNLATGPVQIQVRRGDLEQAKDLLDDLERSDPDAPPPESDSGPLPET